MIYLELFLAYLKIGFFGFGGGYAMLSLIQNEVVVNHHWITSAQLTDIVAISQMTPGPIAVNSATYIGYAVTGNVWGSIVATVAVCLPAMSVMLLLTRFYLRLRNNPYVSGTMKGMQPMMLGLIAAAALLLLTPETFVDWRSWAFFAGTLALAMMKVNPILLIAVAGAVSFFVYY